MEPTPASPAEPVAESAAVVAPIADAQTDAPLAEGIPQLDAELQAAAETETHNEPEAVQAEPPAAEPASPAAEPVAAAGIAPGEIEAKSELPVLAPKPKPIKAPKKPGATAAIIATVIIVFGLSILAVIAYLKSPK